MAKKIKLSQWAALNGMGYQTAYRHYQKGFLSNKTWVSPTNKIYVVVQEEEQVKQQDQARGFVLYARVSGHDQREDLQRQMQRLKAYAASRGYAVADQIEEVGSGMNGERKKLKKLLEGKEHIIVEHKDRLTRFGFEYIQSALKAQGRRIEVMNQTEEQMDLVQDFVDVCTSMCARIYGKRGAKNRAKKMLECAQE